MNDMMILQEMQEKRELIKSNMQSAELSDNKQDYDIAFKEFAIINLQIINFILQGNNKK